MNYLENDHELYKVVKRKLPGQKKTLKGFKEKQKEVILSCVLITGKKLK